MEISCFFDTTPERGAGPSRAWAVVALCSVVLFGSGCPDCRTTSPPPNQEEAPAATGAPDREGPESEANAGAEDGTEGGEAAGPDGRAEASDPNAAADSIRLLALGDSYTAATGVEEDERWPNVLARRLRSEGHDVAEPELVATGGWTTRELLDGLDAASLDGEFDVVAILIGTNDAMSNFSLDRYRKEFRRVLERAVERAGGDASRVVALTLPDYSVTPAADRIGVEKAKRDVRTFNDIIREEAEAAEAQVVDIAPISDRIEEQPELLADALHPGPEIHAAWADRMVDTVVSIVEESSDDQK